MQITKRRIGLILVIAMVILAVAFAFRPRPVMVDAVPAVRGTIVTTIDEQGITRVRERYVVTSPVAGRHERIDLHAGDSVEPGTVLVRIHPAPLDARTIAQLTSTVNSAERTAAEGSAAARRAAAVSEQAKRDRERLERLSQEGVAAAQALEQARTTELQTARDAEAARFRAEAARFDVTTARAALLAANAESATAPPFEIRSPIHGRVLRVENESEGVVSGFILGQTGMSLMEIGDIGTIEAVIDVLSSDAVRIRPGDAVSFENWGGDQPLTGTVRLIEPSAFTKLSALGVDEQRVNVICDFNSRPEGLADAYRVHARIVIWRGDTLKVPATALFRDGQQWSVFVADGGRARLRRVTVGHQSATESEIARGLKSGELVVTHPSEQLRDGIRVSLR